MFDNEIPLSEQFNLSNHLATLGDKYLQDFPEKEQIQSRISHEEGRNNSVYDLEDLAWWPDIEDLAKKCPTKCQNQENISKIKQILSDFSNADTPIAQELKGILDNTDFVIGICPREHQPNPNGGAVFKRGISGEKNKAVLMVSEVLFDEKNKDILPGLLAHEMGHFIDFYNRPHGNYAKLKWQEGAETFADTAGVLIAKGADYDCNGWANFLANESAKGNNPPHTHTGKHRANNIRAVSEIYDRLHSYEKERKKEKTPKNYSSANIIQELRGISSATKVPYKPQTAKINPSTLHLYQSKKQKS